MPPKALNARGIQSRAFVGLNKGAHDAGLCLIEETRGRARVQLLLKERLLGRKFDFDPSDLGPVIRALPRGFQPGRAAMAESSCGERPLEALSKTAYRRFWIRASKKGNAVGVFERAGGRELRPYIARHNPRLAFVPHHYCHAAAAMVCAPFAKALIVVLDGAGNLAGAFDRDWPELRGFPPPSGPGVFAEALSVYACEGSRLTCLSKEWQKLEPAPGGVPALGWPWSRGLGLLYENAARFVFNNPRHAGKVMGLAAYGRARPIRDRLAFIAGLDWPRRFRGSTTARWEASPHFRYYADVAASVQAHFERSLLDLARDWRRRWPAYDKLVLTGGCALNCLANMRLAESGLYREVYVPPFPGDESIAFGAAQHLRLESGLRRKPVPWRLQRPDLGPVASVPSRAQLARAFGRRQARFSRSLPREAAALLARGRTLGWFQGRSESGPRALGHRSLLASPLKAGIRDLLNRRIKGREGFRPFGCSVPWKRAADYFVVPKGFESPFMSFAPRVRPQWRERLKEVCHIDGTSRVQTVRREQNPAFYDLIEAFGRLTGVYVVLNTSLNVRGEPIAETLQHALSVLDRTPLDALAVQGCLVIKRP